MGAGLPGLKKEKTLVEWFCVCVVCVCVCSNNMMVLVQASLCYSRPGDCAVHEQLR